MTGIWFGPPGVDTCSPTLAAERSEQLGVTFRIKHVGVGVLVFLVGVGGAAGGGGI